MRIFVTEAFQTVYAVSSSAGKCESPNSAAILAEACLEGDGITVSSFATTVDWGEKTGDDVRGRSRLYE